MARQLASHLTIVTFAIVLAAADMVYVPVGLAGHRINLAMLLTWSVMSWTNATLFSVYASYSAGGSLAQPEHSLPLALLALVRETINGV